MEKVVRILIIDDDPGNADYLARILKDFETEVFTHSGQAAERFSRSRYDLMIADQKMPGMTGIDLIKECKNVNEDFLGIIISAYTDSNDLIDAVNSNVIYKYIIKPFTPDILLQNVHRAIETLSLLRRNRELEQKLQVENKRLNEENKRLQKKRGGYGLSNIVGNSAEMVLLKEKISTYANSGSSVLITGETGTGKELVARAIHELSMRNSMPFIKINCTTLSPGLIESELFGFEKGSFTGAAAGKKGFFDVAHGGTVFLDEIGDLSLEVQPKLLRVLQFGTYFPVGGRVEKYTDVRIVAATNAPLEESVSSGTFRKDLFHRINILRIRIPPLRKRKKDILEIFGKAMEREFGNHTMVLTPEAVDLLINYPFPGNVRELETYVYRLKLVKNLDGKITAPVLREIMEPTLVYAGKENKFRESGSLKMELKEIEKSRIENCLLENNFNISRTAEDLGLSRQGLHNKIKRYNLFSR